MVNAFFWLRQRSLVQCKHLKMLANHDKMYSWIIPDSAWGTRRGGSFENGRWYRKSMSYRIVFEMQKPWTVEVVRRVNRWGNGGWDANEMTWKKPCTTEWMNQWNNESMNRWVNESVNQWSKNDSMNQWINQPRNHWTDESMNHWTSAMGRWMVQWINEPMNQCKMV
jgi:predicted transposase YbfD/YdcC